jgi:hypothetical protein
MRQTDRQHARPADRVEHCSHLGDRRLFLQRTQIETNGSALEKLRRRGNPAGQLVKNRPCIGSANAHLGQADLAKSDFNGWFSHSFDGFIHRDFARAKKEPGNERVMSGHSTGRSVTDAAVSCVQL